jgi:hypothetical protein
MPGQDTRGAIHGGALWQPCVHRVEDYARIVAADVNDAWYPPAPAVLQAVARWSRHSNHSRDTSCGLLARAVSKHFAIPEDAVRIGAGASGLLHHFIQSVAGTGDEVLTLSPLKRLRLDARDGFEPTRKNSWLRRGVLSRPRMFDLLQELPSRISVDR